MKKSILIMSVLVLAVLALSYQFIFNSENPASEEPGLAGDMIRVEKPSENATISSPLLVKGEARGNWYFEASFPIRLYDAQGNELGLGIAEAQSDWMTEEYVPFESEIIFSTPTSEMGTLVLQKDNPSGLPEHDAEISIPVRFAEWATSTREISLFFYNPSQDEDQNGNILCTSQGLVEVKRRVPITITPIQDAIRLLLQGQITTQERLSGVETEFPLGGFSLVSASLSNGVLTLSFSDPQNSTVGGACRVSILRAQIEATAKQFDEVQSVKFLPEDIFQP